MPGIVVIGLQKQQFGSTNVLNLNQERLAQLLGLSTARQAANATGLWQLHGQIETDVSALH